MNKEPNIQKTTTIDEMKDIKLKKFINDVTNLSVGEVCNKIEISESTLRHRWNSVDKRKEVIFLIAGFTAEQGNYAEKLIKNYY
ncbi:hypothetical protein [Shewanella vaxholmensis]|uniref:Transcriptional regulator n=1 Tax=Shewanella vaxholmensis TaxID=3063535 RepID=A0ABU9UXC3_9GAMM